MTQQIEKKTKLLTLNGYTTECMTQEVFMNLAEEHRWFAENIRVCVERFEETLV